MSQSKPKSLEQRIAELNEAREHLDKVAQQWTEARAMGESSKYDLVMDEALATHRAAVSRLERAYKKQRNAE